jgi:aromatic ring hydroxylase
MKLKNGAEYIDSLRHLKPVIYYKGTRIKDVTRHSATAAHVRAAAMTGGTAMVESMHGAGSPQAQRIMIFREGKLAEKVKLAKALAGIPQKRQAQKE